MSPAAVMFRNLTDLFKIENNQKQATFSLLKQELVGILLGTYIDDSMRLFAGIEQSKITNVSLSHKPWLQ